MDVVEPVISTVITITEEMKEIFNTHHQAIKVYTSCSRLVNDGCRSGVILDYADMLLNEIVTAINKVSEITHPHRLYRGVIPLSNKCQYSLARAGSIITDNGLMSKSGDIKQAQCFSDEQDFMLIIDYPAGIKQLFVGFSDCSENEFLTYPGESLLVKSRTGNTIYCDFIGYHHQQPAVTNDEESIRAGYSSGYDFMFDNDEYFSAFRATRSTNG